MGGRGIGKEKTDWGLNPKSFFAFSALIPLPNIPLPLLSVFPQSGPPLRGGLLGITSDAAFRNRNQTGGEYHVVHESR